MPLISKALFSFLILALAACQPDSELRSAPTISIDLSYELIDESANVVSLDDFDAQLRLVFFGFTTCPDICPITLQNVAMTRLWRAPANKHHVFRHVVKFGHRVSDWPIARIKLLA